MCKWYEFHNWKDIKKVENGTFMNEKYSRVVNTEYRICDKCELIQGYFYDSQGGSWMDEVPEFQEIIKKKLKFMNNNYIL